MTSRVISSSIVFRLLKFPFRRNVSFLFLLPGRIINFPGVLTRVLRALQRRSVKLIRRRATRVLQIDTEKNSGAGGTRYRRTGPHKNREKFPRRKPTTSGRRLRAGKISSRVGCTEHDASLRPVIYEAGTCNRKLTLTSSPCHTYFVWPQPFSWSESW